MPRSAILVLSDRMAKTAARASAFVQDLRGRIAPHVAREDAELASFRAQEGARGDMRPWDVLYWSERQRRAKYDLDEEVLAPYFPDAQVLEGVFEIARRLYGVAVEPWPDAPVWHPDVRAYRMRDETGALLASFYTDLFPRASKQDGAWMHGVWSGVGGEPHTAFLCANLTPPSGASRALLRVREVETVFHEFGHLLHHCLSAVPVRLLAGTNVATDFVELPSKIMENWFWEKDAQSLFARHHATGEPLPDPLFQKLRRARTYRAGNALMRQLGFAATDIALHASYDPAKDGDVVAYARKVFQPFSPAKLPDDYAMVASFLHLFSDPVGYAGGYYSYSWADVLDADAFRRFRAEGVFNGEVGRAFREAVLSTGNSDEPMALYQRFTGHEPEVDALLERAGLG